MEIPRARRKAIGYMPIYVPRELIHATGMLPVGIFGGGDRLEIIRGDSYFQSYICHTPRSTIELALSGRLDVLNGMLFSSICDVVRKYCRRGRGHGKVGFFSRDNLLQLLREGHPILQFVSAVFHNSPGLGRYYALRCIGSWQFH